MRLAAIVISAAVLSLPAAAEDSSAWLESQGLEASERQQYQEFEAVVARVKGGKDAVDPQERVIVLRHGRPVWQPGAKDAFEPASRFRLYSLGRDLDGDGQPDLHFAAYSGGAHCCTTHFIYRLKPAVRRVASYASGNSGGSDFIDVAGRKAPVMISADDVTAYAFGPYSDSYFPVVVLEVASNGRLQLVPELMRPKLPGMPPPICAQATATANAWLKARCAEFSGSKAKARTAGIQARLREVKGARSSEKAKLEDYQASGVLLAIAAEMNRYTYTGYAGAGASWLESVWPGNDAIKAAFLAKLRETQAKSVFADDLRKLSAAGPR